MPKKLPNRTTLRNEADTLFSKLIRSRGVCQLKGLDDITCAGSLQTMHIVGRANRRLRWDEMNALCGCSGHHIWYTVNPWDWNEIIQKQFPKNYTYITEHKNEKIFNLDYNEVILKLKLPIDTDI